MSRARMGPKERAFRSRLAKLVHQEPLMRGTLTVREVTCGKPNCRCARGERHVALYLSYRKQGRFYQIYVPRNLAAEMRQWVQNYHTVRDLLEQVSQTAWARLKSLKG